MLNTISKVSNRIDHRLKGFMKSKGNPIVFKNMYPSYGYPDVYRAIQNWLKDYRYECIQTSHHEDLTSLFTTPAEVFQARHRNINSSPSQPWKTAYDQEDYFPLSSFWLCRNKKSGETIIIRFFLQQYSSKGVIEVATPSGGDPQAIIESIRKWATANSVYRDKMLTLQHRQEISEDYDEPVGTSRVEMIFLPDKPIKDSAIVIQDKIREILDELLFDYDRIKDHLPRYNMEKKRGLLFYGPPGTGKTFTTKYIAGKLEKRTTLVCHGSILAEIKSVASIAIMLSPSLVVLEDVDLFFQQREENRDHHNLSEFMDVLDGFSPTDDVMFILNTNSLERVEEAIKNRPGRISQCVYFGPPTEEMRKLHIERMLELHNGRMDDCSELAKRTEGCTQAFLKELIQRCIQKELSIKPPKTLGAPVIVKEDVALGVLDRMRQSGEDGQKVLGFKV